jgi:hypothetical protein
MEAFITTEIKPAGYAIITMAREPVNSMDLEFWKLLASHLTALEKDPSVRGVILISGLKRDVRAAALLWQAFSGRLCTCATRMQLRVLLGDISVVLSEQRSYSMLTQRWRPSVVQGLLM